MKIFDYHELKKGPILDNVKYSGNGECVGMHREIPIHSMLDSNNEEITADKYNTDYILMCTGLWGPPGSHDAEKEWKWMIVPCQAIVDEMREKNQQRWNTTYYKGSTT